VGAKGLSFNRPINAWVNLFMRFLNREKWETSFWSRKIPVSAKVSQMDLFFHCPAYIGPDFFRKYGEFRARHKSLSHPSTPFFNEEIDLPAIEITIDCSAKDSKLLVKVIEFAETNTLNPISKIKVVVPGSDFQLISAIIADAVFQSQVLILDEDTLLNKDLRDRIKSLFPNRYGWILHQFLTLQQILNSSSIGILSIDSDTLILRPMAFLNNDGVQVLMESLEYNKTYYEFLNKVNSIFPIKTPTHVTHYSFFQKHLFVGILAQLGISDLMQLVDYIEEYADLNSASAICIDRELYALGLIAFYPDAFTLVKFANKSVSFDEISNLEKVRMFSEQYNSISAHSYHGIWV
jgi:hypothetical protein